MLPSDALPQRGFTLTGSNLEAGNRVNALIYNVHPRGKLVWRSGGKPMNVKNPLVLTDIGKSPKDTSLYLKASKFLMVAAPCYNVFKKFGGTLWYLVKFGCVTHCVMEYIGDFVFCTGPSMEPTIYENNIVVSDQLSVWLRRIDKGDIVIAKQPHDRNQLICKRVTGLPGDKVWAGYSYQKVPRGHIWLEGDNKRNSTDSREYGPVPQGLLRGRVVCRVWPVNDMRMFS